MNELALFAGAGGGILGGKLLGWRTVCAVERDAYAASVLAQRQTDGFLDPFPIWSDVCRFDGRPWSGIVDVVSGGFPCQDISAAGKGAGIDGQRSGLWREFARIIGEVRPQYVLVENSPVLTSRGLGRVLGDLASLGFDAQWGMLGACDVGAPHKRERIWIVAHAIGHGARQQIYCDKAAWPLTQRPAGGLGRSGGGCCAGDVADSNGVRQQQSQRHERKERGRACNCGQESDLSYCDCDCVQGLEPQAQPSRHGRPIGLHSGAPSLPPWATDPADSPESGVGRVADGVAHRVDRLKAIGNGQVPQCAALAFTSLNNF